MLACSQGEEPLVPAGLWYDCAILRKLMYKNKSQHRRTKYYQHLQAVERNVRLLRLTCCDELAAAMAQSIQQGLVKATLPVVSMHRTLGYGIVCFFACAKGLGLVKGLWRGTWDAIFMHQSEQ